MVCCLKKCCSLLLLLSISCKALAINEETAQLKNEVRVLRNQLSRLEEKIIQQSDLSSAIAADKKFYLKGISITPGGFFAGEGVWRSRNEQADIGSTFVNIPTANNPLYYMNELRFSARQSRASVLIKGKIAPLTLLSGFAEVDFLGNGTGNQVESNSFDLRIRAFYAYLEQNDWGLHVLAGQNWSLATTNAHNFKGSTPRNEIVPPTIDPQYIVGFVWKRLPQFRIIKDFGLHTWAAISIETPQTTFGGIPPAGNGFNPIFNEVIGITYLSVGNASLPGASLFSLNQLPDVISKIAFESTIKGHKMHLEAIGMYRAFYDRVQFLGNRASNFNTSGWGLGGGGIIEIIPALFDIQGNMLAGHGIGSYASGQLPDVTINSHGALAAIPEVVFSIGATFHVTKTLDLYLFGGAEREKAQFFQVGNHYFGYGIPTANNSGCTIENGVNCTGNTQNLWEITTGFWDKLYTGNYGELRFGLQYAYIMKTIFPGNDNGLLRIPQGSKTNENMAFVSLRYYPFT